MFLGTYDVDDWVTFPANTHTPSTGAATDADAVPAFRIYEDETGTAIETGNMAKLDDASTTGFYSERRQLTAAAGYEVGKTYTVYISAAVGAVTGTMAHTFNIRAAPLATAANLATVDTVVDAIKAVTDLIPDAGAMNDLATILTDTNELQGDWTNGGRLDLIVDDILADTAAIQPNVDATISSRATPAQVNTEVDNALDTAIPGVPTANSINERIAALDDLLQAGGGGDAAAILTDTNELQGDWVNGGRLDLLIDAILADTGELQTDWVNGGRLDLLIDAIKAKTDNLPADPADDSDIDAQLATIDANVDLILADTGTDGVVLTAAAIDAILDDVVEGTLTVRQILRLLLAFVGGKTTGAATATVAFRDNADAKDRISMTVDSDGDRSAVTLDGA